ncbi:hypothetical protein KKB44_00300 [Candidatus Micrarchaeota archaeon]|nr:hypothetical protein [Candidatus Micrarchaeota archaeon]
MSGQATVEVNRLNDTVAQQEINSVLRGNTVVLTIPLLEANDDRGRGNYLVVTLPAEAYEELRSEAESLPEEERNAFVRDWIRQNQNAAIEQYLRLRSESGEERVQEFSYDVVPVRRDLELVPIPVDRDVTVTVPVRVEPPVTTTEEPELQIRRREPVPVELPELPDQVREGNGTRENPYVVRLQRGREESGVGAIEIENRLNFDVEGTDIYLTLNMALSQLTVGNRAQTATELTAVLRGCARRYSAEHGIPYSRLSIPTLEVLDRYADRVSEANEEAREYLESH